MCTVTSRRATSVKELADGREGSCGRNDGGLGRSAESLQRPEILSIFAAEHVALAVSEEDAKVGGARGVPTVFDFGDVEQGIAKLQFDGTLVAFVSGVALDADKLVSQVGARRRDCRRVRRSTPRREK